MVLTRVRGLLFLHLCTRFFLRPSLTAWSISVLRFFYLSNGLQGLVNYDVILMKKVLSLLLAVCFSATMFADDVIVTKDSQRINAKIEEVGLDVVKYRRSDNVNGPLYTLAKTEIVTILYENGTIETFQQESKPAYGNQQMYNNQPARYSNQGMGYNNQPYWNNPARLTLIGNNVMQNGRTLTRQEYIGLLQNTCPEAWTKYNEGSKLIKWGWGLFGSGLGLGLVGGLVCIGEPISGLTLSCAGACAAIACIPVICIGSKRQRESVDVYNQACMPYISLNLISGKDGIGLAINF